MCRLNAEQAQNRQYNRGRVEGIINRSRNESRARDLISIPVKLLAIDESYQTSNRTERDMRYLINNWDEHKLLPLVVVPHPEEGVFAIVDGYGRFVASQAVDAKNLSENENYVKKYEELWCLVILDAPTNKDDRQKFEAEQYAYQNRDVAKVTPLQKHGAGLVMKLPEVLAIENMKNKYHFVYGTGRGFRSVGVLGSYATCVNIAKRNGTACIDYIFSVIDKTGWNRNYNGYSKYAVLALKDIWSLYPQARETSVEAIEAVLRGKSTTQVIAEARVKYPTLNTNTAMSLHLEDIICETCGQRHMREIVDGVIRRVS